MRRLLLSCKLHSTSSGTIFITITPKEYRRLSEREIWLERKSPARWSSCCNFPHSSSSTCRAVLSICRLGLVVLNGKLFFNKLRQAQWRCSLEHWWREDCWSLDYWFLNYKWPHGYSRKAENEKEREGRVMCFCKLAPHKSDMQPSREKPGKRGMHTHKDRDRGLNMKWNV